LKTEKIRFQKFCGSGNDFIIIDNRDNKIKIKKRAEFAKKYCQRRLSVGADGVMFLENSQIADFKMRLFQPDGSEAEMCGNGARCLARYAFSNGIVGKSFKFETIAGIIDAIIYDNSVAVKLTAPKDLRLDCTIDLTGCLAAPQLTLKYSFINTGVPHSVFIVDDISKIKLKELGNFIRFHKDFAPAGTNVNFIQKNKDNTISIRTYERGVEDETLACGTGSTAAALIAALKLSIMPPVSVITASGLILKIHFDLANLKAADFEKLNLFLEGDAELVYSGELEKSIKFIG